MWDRMYRKKLMVLLGAKRKAGYGLEAIKRLEAGRSIIYKVGDEIVEEFPPIEIQEIGLDAAVRSPEPP